MLRSLPRLLTTMPPKKKPPTSQTSLNTFFATPKKPAAAAAAGKAEVIEVDSEDEVIMLDDRPSSSRPQPKKEPVAKEGKGKGKRPRDQLTPERDPLFVPSTPSRKRPAQMVSLQSPHQNGEPSTRVKAEFVKEESDEQGKAIENAPRNPFGSKTIPKAEKQVLNFDVDPLMFRPEDIKVDWAACGGRLPYEVLVESVYLPVGGTRSRLAIGRVLTK